LLAEDSIPVVLSLAVSRGGIVMPSEAVKTKELKPMKVK
jgi:hypothetical protein